MEENQPSVDDNGTGETGTDRTAPHARRTVTVPIDVQGGTDIVTVTVGPEELRPVLGNDHPNHQQCKAQRDTEPDHDDSASRRRMRSSVNSVVGV